jgi:hypothetical protein
MHKMERTPMIITIIGMVIEGISSIVLIGVTILFFNIQKIPGLRNAAEAELSPSEYADLIAFLGYIGYFILAMSIVYTMFFIVNLILFPGLMKERYTEEKAKNIYLYQAIWGGISLMSNQITGILYLISGVQGYNGRKDKVNERDVN